MTVCGLYTSILSLNIDPGRRLGMSTLKSHGCSLCAPATNTDGTTTRGRIVATRGGSSPSLAALARLGAGARYAKLPGAPLSLTSCQHAYKSAVLALGLPSYPPPNPQACGTRSHQQNESYGSIQLNKEQSVLVETKLDQGIA